MPDEDLAQLRAFLSRAGLNLRLGADADDKLRSLRRLYEPYVNGLSCHLLIPLPPWLPASGRADNWQTSAFDRAAAPFASSAAAKPDEERRHF
jgi:hypothetical protein